MSNSAQSHISDVDKAANKTEAALPDLNSAEVVLQKEEEQWRVQREARGVKWDGTERPVGLAISGGGIRSATLALGVLQWLCSKRTSKSSSDPQVPLIDQFDYLSTVSGGGYIGSWFTANRWRQNGNLDFITQPDSPQLSHLRRFSRYLSPQQGLMNADFWTILTSWFRNAFLIQLMVFSVVAVGMIIVRAMHLGMEAATKPSVYEHCSGIPFLVAFILPLAVAACFSGRELWQYRIDESKNGKPRAGGQNWVQWTIGVPTFISAVGLTWGLWWRRHLIKPAVEPGWGPKFAEDNGTAMNAVLQPVSWWVCGLLGLIAVALVLLPHSNRNRFWKAFWKAFFVFLSVTASNLTLIYMLDELMMWLQAGASVVSLPGAYTGGDAAAGEGGISWLRSLSSRACPHGYDISSPLVFLLGPFVVCLSYALIVITGLGAAGRDMKDKIREWWSRLGAWLLIYSAAWLGIVGVTLFGPFMVDWVRLWSGSFWSHAVQTGLLTGWLASVAGAVFFGNKGGREGGGSKSSRLSLNQSALTFVAMTGLLVAGAWLVRYILTPDFKQTPGMERVIADPFLMHAGSVVCLRWWCALGIAASVALICVLRVDLNEFSMNHFYRNRLVRCYLGGSRKPNDRMPHPFTGFDFGDDIKLAEFGDVNQAKQRNFRGPYPLINTALNTAQGNDLMVQERMAESFLLSPLFCGWQRENTPVSTSAMGVFKGGYRQTNLYMKKEKDPEPNGHLLLGTAMSISGAAASPNSGYHTSPVMAFLLTIFNARLGWWVPNPAKDKWRSVSPGFFKCLARELFGSATANSEFVYLSDGGHFDNLGLYELVRRRCRFILAIDGEQDGKFTFHALGTAIRRCRIDFQAEIEINVDDLRPVRSGGLSKNHGAVGRIIYADKTEGVLVYLKSSLTGDEGTDINQYHSSAPNFPHQSTGDQWFSESQFESYRALGNHVADAVMGPALKKHRLASCPAGQDLIDCVADQLRTHWFRPPSAAPDVFVDHTQALDRLWKELADPAMPRALASLVVPNWQSFADGNPQPVLPPTPTQSTTTQLSQKDREKAYLFCQRLIQFMESVYLDLDLRLDADHIDNAGWIRLFKHWVSNKLLQEAWVHSKHTFGNRFHLFWDDLTHD